jgi:multidrug resistance efflux pump
VRTGVLAYMDTEHLTAHRREAEAQLQRATIAVQTGQSLVQQREAERKAAAAGVAQHEAMLDAAARRLARSEPLASARLHRHRRKIDNIRLRPASPNLGPSNVRLGKRVVPCRQSAIAFTCAC